MNTHHVLNVSNCNEEKWTIMWFLVGFGIVLACLGISIMTAALNDHDFAFMGCGFLCIFAAASLILIGLEPIISAAAC